MIIDAWNFYYICEELKSEFLNSKLVKIKIIEDYSFVFEFLTFQGVKKVLVDLTYGVQCIFALEKTTEIKKKDVISKNHDFLMILRKNIINSKIRDIYIYDWDRVIVFEFDDKKLIFEMFGKSSNIILISDKDYIIGCLKRFTPSGNIHKKISDDDLFNNSRQIINGKKYYFPKNSNISPGKFLDITKIDFYKGFSKISRQMLNIFFEQNNIHAFYEYRNIIKEEGRIILLKNQNIPIAIFPLNVKEYEPYEFERFFDYKTLFNNIYSRIKYSLEDDKEKISKLNFLNREKKKLLKRLQSIENIQKMQQRCDNYVLYAELLKSVLYKFDVIKSDFIEVENYFSESLDKVNIPVKKNKNISVSMENYFNLARKEKKRIENNVERISEIKENLKNIENQILNIDCFDIPVRKINKIPEKIYGNVKKIIYKQIVYYVGKNADDNDYILSHIAKGNDIWFHAQNIKGAHVVCKYPKSKAQPDIIIKGAELAAKNCEIKKGGTIPVDYTEVKYVKKIKGIKGKVTFSNNKTVFVKI